MACSAPESVAVVLGVVVVIWVMVGITILMWKFWTD